MTGNMHNGFSSEFAPRRVRAWAAIEILLMDEEVPEERNDATVEQAIQDAIGHTGAVVKHLDGWNNDEI